MIGVVAHEMLNMALKKKNDGILYLCQDMHELDLWNGGSGSKPL